MKLNRVWSRADLRQRWPRVNENRIEEQVQMSKSIPIDPSNPTPSVASRSAQVAAAVAGVRSREKAQVASTFSGSPDQNLMLLGGVPLYSVNHLFGFFSVFNADAEA